MAVSASIPRGNTDIEHADGQFPPSIEKEMKSNESEARNSGRRDTESSFSDPDASDGAVSHGHHSHLMSKYTWFLVSFSTMVSVFLFALDNTIVANAQPSIVRTYGEVEKLPWIALAFALGSIATCITWGRLYNLFDGKKLLLTALFLFEVGSAICGAAPTFNSLIVGRTIAGVGGAGIYIGTLNIFARFTSLRERPLYMAFIGSMWSAGTILGPIVGGAFADSRATWRWAFYINLCIAGPTAPVLLFLLPSQKPPSNGSTMQRLSQLDFLGIILFAGATASLIMGINFGGTIYPWHSGQVISLFVVSGILWIIFVVQQVFSLFTTPSNRIFPIRFIKSLQITLLAAQCAACTAVISILLYFTPLYYQYIRGESAVRSGVLLLPWCFVAVVAAMINGLALAKVGFYMPWFFVGGVLMVIGDSLMQTINATTSYARIIGYGTIQSFGAGLFIQSPFAIAQAKVLEKDVIDVTTFVTCGQITGITIGLSIAASVFINQATVKLMDAFPGVPTTLVQSAIQGADTELLSSLPVSQRRFVLDTIVEAIDEAFILMIVGGSLVILMSLFMKRERLVIPAFF